MHGLDAFLKLMLSGNVLFKSERQIRDNPLLSFGYTKNRNIQVIEERNALFFCNALKKVTVNKYKGKIQ